MAAPNENAHRAPSRRELLKAAALGGIAAIAGVTLRATASGQPVVARVLDTSAAELYKVKPDFKRFNPRYTAFSRSFWDKSCLAYGAVVKYRMVRRERVKRGDPGFSLKDYALNMAVDAVRMWTGSAYGNRNKGLYSWDPLQRVEKLGKYEADPAEAARTIKRAARYLGADLVGICLLDKRWVYSHTPDGRPIVFEDVEEWYETEEKVVIPESHKYVVVIAVRMDPDMMKYVPLLTGAVEICLGYDKMAIVAARVAEFIRHLGYHALPMGNDTALSIPLAIDAGLGQLGRSELLVTPEFGPSIRLAKIFTDLPMGPDRPIDFGLTEFCDTCMKCVDACPIQAISRGPPAWEGPTKSNISGVLKWRRDPEKCLAWWSFVGTGCGICIRVCPWTKGIMRSSALARWVAQHIPGFGRLWRAIDDALGYGALRNPEEFWRESE